MELAGYAASLAMGMILGLMGGGGSILTVPIMVYLFRVQPSTATGYSLFVVGLTALAGSILFIRRGDVDFRAAMSFAFPSIAGVFFSRQVLLPALPHSIFRIGGFELTKDLAVMGGFAILMLLASTSMIRKRKGVEPRPMSETHRTVMLGIQGLLVGVLAGFVGAGGGFLIIPALVIFARLPMRSAVGTSLLIIAAQSLLGFTGDLRAGAIVNWPLLLSVAALAITGIVVGSQFAHRVKEQRLKVAFGWFVLVMGVVIFAEQISHF